MISSVLPTYARAPLKFVKGEGSWLITEDGRRYWTWARASPSRFWVMRTRC